MTFGHEQPILGRGVDDPHDRASVFNDSNVDGEFAILVDDFLCAIERIDQSEPGAMFRHIALTEGFLGNHRQVRLGLGEGCQDKDFSALVGFGDRGGVANREDLESYVTNREDW